MNSYDDIINLSHPEPKKHIRMARAKRAAQFAPFAALTGHDEAVKETARLTDKKIELDEHELERLNEKIALIFNSLEAMPEVIITYFIPDEKKTGGKYVDCRGCVLKVDDYNRVITMSDETIINMDMIIDIQSDIFPLYE